MTALEIALLAAAPATLGLRYADVGSGAWGVVATFVLAMLVVVHLATHPWRWQMAPLYVLVAALAITTAAGFEGAGVIRHAGFLAGLLLAGVSAALASALPAGPLPAPSGPHAVGVVSAELERSTTNSDGEDAARRLLVRAWYPAEAPAPPRSREPLWSELYERRDLPPAARVLLRYLGRVRTHSHRDAPVLNADAPLPLLVYNHALVSFASENTLLMERLASEGWLVLSVRHLDQAAEHAAIQAALTEEEKERDRALQGRLAGDLDRAERARVSEELYRTSTGTPLIVARRADDARFVIDHIADVLAAIPGCETDACSATERYGALGLSLGGAVATRLCQDDPRCAGAANIDGGLYGVDEGTRLSAPYLMLYSEQNAGANDAIKGSASGAYEEQVFAGAAHLDFHDATVAAPGLRWLGALGRAHGAAIVRRKNDAVADFFGKVFGRGDAAP